VTIPWRSGSGVQGHRFAARILLADDEPAVARVMALYLRRLGYEVAECRSGQEAWAAFDAAPGAFDLVVSDLTLPDISGLELLARMKARNPALAVVVSSGYPVDPAMLPAGSPEQVAFLQKPFAPGMLAELVERLLSNRPRAAGL
jgi:two-component system, cell cycle sensor histidine kinase and response regulator CckA